MDRKLLVLFALPILFSCSQEESAAPAVQVEVVTTTAVQTTAPFPTPVADEPAREITNISGDLYRARNNGHYTVFLVTSEGTILADPLNVEFAEWLKAELAERFDSNVRYVLYSHHHWDHASGGAVFEDTAQFVGHENMVAELAKPLPSDQINADKNGDGMVHIYEARGGTRNSFNLLDINGDDELTGEEINSNIRPPEITYSDTYTVRLGEKEVELIHAGNSHTSDGSILFFPEERVGFAADYIGIRRLPGGFAGVPLDHWIDAIDRMIGLDIDTVSTGHGRVGTHADVVAYGQYFRDLAAAVDAAIADNVSLDDLQANIKMDAYEDWDGYDRQLPRNIDNAYKFKTKDSDWVGGF